MKTATTVKSDTFKVHSFKPVEDPAQKIERYEMVVALDQYPADFGLGPNPRLPNLNSPVSKKIGDSLKDNNENFHLLNRGVTIVAKGLEYDSRTHKVRLVLGSTPEEDRNYGILDGGNTNERLNKWRSELTEEEHVRLAGTFVNVQVLIPVLEDRIRLSDPMVSLLNDIKEARNTSVQVKSKSLADARRHFDVFKEVLANEPYFSRISWKEGQSGSIDALQLITLLMLYYPTFSGAADGEPSTAYGHKERCLDAYLDYSETEPDKLEAWIKQMPSILQLFDKIQATLPDYYSGRFGKIEEVRIFDKKRFERGGQGGDKKYRSTPTVSQFMLEKMKYQYPVAWIFPVFAAFRHLIGSENKIGTKVSWKKDPIEFWKQHGTDLVKRFEPHIREAGYESKKIATNFICYQAMGQAVKELNLSEMLEKAGIKAA